METTFDFGQTPPKKASFNTDFTQGCVPTTLRSLTLLQALDDDHILLLASQCQTLQVKRGDVIFNAGDTARSIYAVVNGWLKLGRETLDGSEAILDVLHHGHILGEQALLTPHHTYHATATAVDACTLIAMPLNLLSAWLTDDSKLAAGLLKTMAFRERLRDMELENRALKNAPQRIGCFLLRLCPPTQHSGEIVLHLPYDKTLLAAQMGMQPETFSRALARLKTDAQLDIKGASVHVADVRTLREYTCSGCSGVFPCEDLRETP